MAAVFYEQITYEKLFELDKLQAKYYQEDEYGDELPVQLEYPRYAEEHRYIVEIEEDLKNVPNVKSVLFQTFDNGHKIDELVNLPPTTEAIYLGHDGVIICEGDLHDTLIKILKALPKLIWLEYCGYYCDIYKNILDQVCEETGRKIFHEPIY